MENLSDFIINSLAVRTGDTGLVYADGVNKIGKIYDCVGNTEYEAKEDAFDYLNKLKESIEK